jgi:DNA adenine methylase
MTAYHGGKQRIGKEIASVIYDVSTIFEREFGFKIKGYCEPFCGMLGVYQHIIPLFERDKPRLQYKSGDVNGSVIKMWKEAQKGWNPPAKIISKEEYDKLRKEKDSAKKGFYCCVNSFRGVFCGSYFTHNISRIQHSSNNIQIISQICRNVKFEEKPYERFSHLKNYIIYCDPPYGNTRQLYINNFDTDKFWEWCKRMSKDNIVIVSEYSSPSGFLIWEKKSDHVSYQEVKTDKSEKLFLVT